MSRFRLIALLCCLPLLGAPELIGRCPTEGSAKTFVMLYPIYVVLTAYLAVKSYPERPTLAWILLALLLLTHAAIWLLILL